METARFTAIATSRLFSGIPAERLAGVYREGTIVALGAGEILINEGQPNADLYIVLSGQLRIALPKKNQRFAEIRLGRLGPGDFIGEYSFLDHKPASATVSAVEPTFVFKLDTEELEEILTEDPVLGRIVYRNLMFYLVDRLRAKDAELDLFQPAWPTADGPPETSDHLAEAC
jgi:CRP-like cAMP-binding protein